MTVTVLKVPIAEADRDRLADLARITGRSEEEIAVEAIHGFLELNELQIAGIEEALASLARGEGVPHDDVKAWAESLGTANPLPKPGRRRG